MSFASCERFGKLSVVPAGELADVLVDAALDSVLGEALFEDVAVGAAAELHAREAVRYAEHLVEGEVHCEGAGAARVEQRVIDIEEEYAGHLALDGLAGLDPRFGSARPR